MFKKIEVAGGEAILMPTDTPKVQIDGLITADDYNLDEVYVITAKDRTNIKAMMVEMSYYEDIFKGVASGSILINDSISLIDRLAMTGFDYLKLKFKKTTRASEESITEKYFRIYRVSERLLNNNASETYTLHFCSEELLLSEQSKISKSYTNKKISEIIYDILLNKLRIDEKYIRLQETEGLYDFVIPYMKPLEAINWLSNYAKPIGKEGADFLFYESSEGFNFYSLQNLFTQNAYTTYAYIPRSVGETLVTKSKELGRNLVGIKSYVFLDTFDTLYGTITGAFANRLISIDPLTRTYKDTTFDYSTYFKKSKNLNEHSLVPDIKNRLGKRPNENYDAVLKVSVSNPEQKKAIGISEQPWNVANDIRAENYIPNRTAQLSLSHYSRIKLAVSGDPNLTVGMLLEIYLPSSRSKDGSGYESGEEDPYNSGKYMITAVRHIIDYNNKYETILEVVKDSYGESINNYENSADMQKAIEGDV